MFTFKIETTTNNTYCAGSFDNISSFGQIERDIILLAMCKQSQDCAKHMISASFVHVSQAYEDTIWLKFDKMPERDTSRTWEEIMSKSDINEFKL